MTTGPAVPPGPPYVAVVGPGSGGGPADPPVDAEVLAVAYEVGMLLALAGAVVLTGGLGGVMESAAHGAHATGGTTVGLLPGERRDDLGEHLTVALPTGLGEMRNALLVRAADAVVCVGGSWGTLSEVALAVRAGVPVVSVHGWRVLDAAGTELPLVRAETAEAAVRLALESWQRRSPGA